jgi:hypothetical protein
METVYGIALGIMVCALMGLIAWASWEDGRRVGRDERRRGCGETS